MHSFYRTRNGVLKDRLWSMLGYGEPRSEYAGIAVFAVMVPVGLRFESGFSYSDGAAGVEISQGTAVLSSQITTCRVES